MLLNLLAGAALRSGRFRQTLRALHASDDVLENLADAVLELQLHQRLANFALDRLARALGLLGCCGEPGRALLEALQHRANVLLRIRNGLLIAARYALVLGADLHQG